MKNKQIIFGLSIFLFLFLIPLINAQEESGLLFRELEEADLQVPCIFNGSTCDGDYICNITTSYPNTILLINNQVMTNQSSFYNYTIPANSLNASGTYSNIVVCNDGTFAGIDRFTFEVSPTGFILSTSQGIIYFLILILSLGLFGLSLIGAIKIPWANPRDDERIIGVNMLKYGKLSLWFVSYIFLVWMAWLTWNISFGFLNFDVASKFFEVIFKILLALTFPVFTIFFVALVVNFLTDKKLKKALERGLVVKF